MKKIKLTPLQNAVMWLLEEAGEETSLRLQVTLRAQGYDNDSELIAALQGLQRCGFVLQSESSVVLTENGKRALTR
jgi:hypothetical protein